MSDGLTPTPGPYSQPILVRAADPTRGYRRPAPRWENSKPGPERQARMLQSTPAHVYAQLASGKLSHGAAIYAVDSRYKSNVERWCKKAGVKWAVAPYPDGSWRLLTHISAPATIPHASRLDHAYGQPHAISLAHGWLKGHDWSSGKQRRLTGSAGITIHAPAPDPEYCLVGRTRDESREDFAERAQATADNLNIKLYLRMSQDTAGEWHTNWALFELDGRILDDAQRLVDFYEAMCDDWFDYSAMSGVMRAFEVEHRHKLRRCADRWRGYVA